MQVTTAIKDRVVAKLNEGIAKAAARYNITIPFPTVLYTKRGTTAGVANYRHWTVNFNPVLLMENVDKFITRTVPHELAHLICDRVYPHAHESEVVRTATGWKRTKRDVHGSYWKEVMRVIGVPAHEITRCHNYDVTNAKRVVNRTSYAYKCVTCSADFNLGPQRHAKLVRNPGALTCRRCGRVHGRLVLAAAHTAAAPARAIAPPAPAAAKKAATGTKLEQCYAIYKRLQQAGDLTRAYAITAFMTEVGMTKAGASTYFSTCQKMG